MEGPDPPACWGQDQGQADHPGRHLQPQDQPHLASSRQDSLSSSVRRSFRQGMLVLLFDDCPSIFNSFDTEFYVAGSVRTMYYLTSMMWLELIQPGVTLFESCKRRELSSAVIPAALPTAVSSSQLAKPTAAKKCFCLWRRAHCLTVEGPDLSACKNKTRDKLTIQDATYSHSRNDHYNKLTRREVAGLKSV